MADKPLYYGGKGQPMYYGGGKEQPMYYGANRAYGQYGAYGSYGSYGAYGSYGGGNPGEDGTIIGNITLSRMLRVVSQRWLSVFVFLLLGMIVSFVVYRISPTIYESSSEFTMDIRRGSGRTGSALEHAMIDYGRDYAEIFNTRLSEWRSDKIVTMIIGEYRSEHATSSVTDEELIASLVDSKIELQRNSRNITISVRFHDPKIAAALANAYASAIESYTDELNRVRCDKFVSRIHAQAEKKRREVDTLAKQLVDFRTTHKIDQLRSSRDTTQQSLSKTTADILSLETEETQLVEWEKALSAVQKNPETFGSLPTGAQRAQEIAAEYRSFLDASGEHAKLQLSYTDNHPEVVAKAKELEMAKKRFLDATERALQTGRSTLTVVRNQLVNLKQKREDLKSELAALEQRIVLAESSLGILEDDYKAANEILRGLNSDENKARLEAESNNEIITIGSEAKASLEPVLPKPILIFGIGTVLALALGLLFVLVLDNLEDTVVNLSDIEGRLALKVLAVLPHVRRKRREQVAKFLVEDKYSQFSESVAGLRNLLDSPRYEALTHCILVISTQPGEGKTITSTSIAIAYAQTGRRVLHVDFDMRRPRLARVWGIELTPERSFSHTLQHAGGKVPDFSALTNSSPVKGLDVICSLPPDGVSPATIFGTSIVADFFNWAKSHYDRVIIDSPPYGIVGDVVSLATQADSVIIMCCPDRTHFKPIQYCSRSLTEAGANILGVIVNDVEVSSAAAFCPANRQRYGYGYGYGYKPEDADGAAKIAEGKGRESSESIDSMLDTEDYVDDE